MKYAKNLWTACILLTVAACYDNSPVGLDATGEEPVEGARAHPSAHASSGMRLNAQIVDPFRARLALDIVAEGALVPNSPITLQLSGQAAEAISGGEVTVTLPTQASMTYAGANANLYYPTNRQIPVVARWTLPALAKGDAWRQNVTVGTVGAGYYHVAVQVDTRGTPESPYIIDNSYRKAWMFVAEEGGKLTGTFDESVFANRISPVPGPLRAKPPYRTSAASHAMHASAANYSSQVGLHVIYNERGRWQRNAVGAHVWANTVSEEDPDYITGSTQSRTVPSSGIVHFTCPPDGYYLAGGGNLPALSEVDGGSFLGYWEATTDDCNSTKQVTGTDHTYMPWANLKEVIPRVDAGLGGGYHKSRQGWSVDLALDRSRYWPNLDEIEFGETYYNKFTAAHEYGHAVHEYELGGLWGTEAACATHEMWEESGYRCAFQEGMANYAGKVGSLATGSHYDFENPDGDGQASLIEGHVTALFWDLIDSANESNDETTYQAHYVFTVFRTCQVRFGGQLVDRDDVSDFVWCLENQVVESVHNTHFPGITAAGDAYESATEPPHWDEEDIRSTWIQNVGNN